MHHSASINLGVEFSWEWNWAIHHTTSLFLISRICYFLSNLPHSSKAVLPRKFSGLINITNCDSFASSPSNMINRSRTRSDFWNYVSPSPFVIAFHFSYLFFPLPLNNFFLLFTFYYVFKLLLRVFLLVSFLTNMTKFWTYLLITSNYYYFFNFYLFVLPFVSALAPQMITCALTGSVNLL